MINSLSIMTKGGSATAGEVGDVITLSTSTIIHLVVQQQVKH